MRHHKTLWSNGYYSEFSDGSNCDGTNYRDQIDQESILTKNVAIIAKLLGKLGGEATKKKLGKEHFKRISKLGVEAKKK